MNMFKLCSTMLAIIFLFVVAPLAKAQSQNPQQTPMVIRKSTGVLQKSAIHRVAPEYPQAAKAQGISGIVVLEVRVDEVGKVISTKPVSGHQLLVDAAMRAMKDWRFTPTQLSGVAVQVIGNVVFNFTLDGKVSEGMPALVGSKDLPTINILSVETASPVISDKEAKELYQKIQNAYDIPIRINNPDGVVLEITKATVRAVKRDEQNYAPSDKLSVYVTDYAMRAMLTLHNRTSKKITGVGFKFTNTVARHIFFAYPNITGIAAQEDYQAPINFMTMAGNPADLLAEIVGVRFADGTTGGAFPLPPHAVGNVPMPELSSLSDNANPRVSIQVDTKPKPLNRLRPNYTEQARLNKVSGTVRLRVEVGADGSAKKVHVANALPDGLTEEALRIIKVLQFQPAMAGTTPVDYWIVLEVSFNLR